MTSAEFRKLKGNAIVPPLNGATQPNIGQREETVEPTK